ncbi:DUF1345 domain-containing protein [Leucobacter coleopterorum]|uniref:DUF1345 domain-containing protein n=1 Tax=Leucobacter coleopterorum TaxID=2714933 RepID=A0ABX6JY34_9MICO|nr:DUF1345 domain-containing protein [Leucobacter coleopterorum]QIM19211.1 DUF1345 domain-containing protein [Leucobacter coleopterorum]
MSSAFAIVVAILIALPSIIEVYRDGVPREDLLDYWILAYLIVWPLFVLVYLASTHLAYAKRLPQLETKPRTLWSQLFGYGGPSSWTMTAALVSIVLTVFIAQTPDYRSDWVYITLGMLTVVCSWALMVYSFALQYGHLSTAVNEHGTHHITLGIEHDEEPRLGDYLTLAILLSTMAATVSASINTRQAWQTVRANVIFAFIFNTVIVAMMVSLLFGGLSG